MVTDTLHRYATITRALHETRMQPYLDATDGNHKRALMLYRWNSDLSAAVQSVLGHTEVVLRNAMDRELQAWNRSQPGFGEKASWLLDPPAAPLRSMTEGKRLQAIKNAEKAAKMRSSAHPRHGASVTHDDVLAHLMFGVWKELLPNQTPEATNPTAQSRHKILWEQALIKSFPGADDPNGAKTFWLVYHLLRLRNRVSHMEPLLDLDVADLMKDAFKLIRTIDTAAAEWMSGGSQVPVVLARRPTAPEK